MPQEPQEDKEIVPVEVRPVQRTPASALPPIVARTVSICVNCVVAPGRMATRLARERYHRHYHERYRFGRHHLAADLAFVAAIVALIGVNAYVFFARPRPLPSKVRLAWTAEPATVRSGDRVTFTLAYTHTGNEDLRDASVALRLPERFVVELVTPGTYDAETQTVQIGAVAAESSGQIAIRGATDAADGSVLRMEATFHGQGATTAERAVAAGTADVRGIAITVEISPPNGIRPANSLVPLNVQVHTDTDRAWSPIVVTPAIAAPLALRDDLLYGRSFIPVVVPALAASSGSVSFPIVIVTRAPGAFPIRFRIGRRTTSGGTETIGVIEKSFEVTSFPVTVTAERVGDTTPVHLGDQFAVNVRSTIGDIPEDSSYIGKVELRLSGALAAITTLEAKGTDTGKGVVAWRVPLTRGTTRDQQVTVWVPRTVDAATDGVLRFILTPTFVLSAADDNQAIAEIPEEPVIVPVLGELTLASLARYFSPEGDQLGRGPLPPRVGKPTKYWVTWDVRSFVEAADRVVVRATIPASAEWTGKTATTAGDRLIYDPGSRTVTWAIGSIEQTVGKALNAVTASFEVAIVPSEGHIGTFAPLLGQAHAEGVGRTTGEAMSADAASVTTELSGDAYARGKGRVVAQ